MALTLVDLRLGQTAIVEDLLGDSIENQRLMHMGIVEGCEIKLVRKAPSGDPIEISLMGYSLSLRQNDARRIVVSS
jgi:Fe2+ transport system protein FeoA